MFSAYSKRINFLTIQKNIYLLNNEISVPCSAGQAGRQVVRGGCRPAIGVFYFILLYSLLNSLPFKKLDRGHSINY